MGSGGHGMEAVAAAPISQVQGNGGQRERCGQGHFQMPLHYPRYSRADYETMPEWKVDCLLRQYGLPVSGDVDYKRRFAMGSFLWIN